MVDAQTQRTQRHSVSNAVIKKGIRFSLDAFSDSSKIVYVHGRFVQPDEGYIRFPHLPNQIFPNNVETTGNSERIRNQNGHKTAPQVCHEEREREETWNRRRIYCGRNG
jgi:hypothetical protein